MATILLTHDETMRRNFYGERALGELRALGDVLLNETGRALDPPAIVALARDVDIVVSDRMAAAPASVFEHLARTKVFLRCAVDIRNIDVESASRAGILVTRAGPSFVTSVAEMALGMMLDLARHITPAAEAYHAGIVPTARMGRQLSGATVGIIGLGAIGLRLAELCAALGMVVTYNDPHRLPPDPRFSPLSLDELLAQSDVVVCLAVATPATENLLGAAQFARMKRDALFLNLSRGELVDEAALGAALRAGRLGGAALDVGRQPDQMPDPSLAALPNVIATPHAAGLTPDAVEGQALTTARQVAALLRGEVPEGAVNPEAWTRRF